MAGNDELIAQYRAIHASQAYGDTSIKNLRFLRPEIKLLDPHSVIDYGCGQSPLLEMLGLDDGVALHRYDPAIPEYSSKPEGKFDLLINVDVLEHIEEVDLDEVLREMAGLANNAIVIIDTAPAKLVLPDGRNAHVTLKDHDWWQARLSRHFAYLEPIGTARRTRAGFKTWKRAGLEANFRHAALRAEETLRHYGRRLTGARDYR